jgi:hypothetical protein
MLPLAALVAASLILVAAPAASADQTIAVDITAKHDVVWNYVETGYPDKCRNWAKGSGTQTIRIHSERRELMRLEKAFGNTMLTGKRAGTFDGLVSRVGKWEVNVPQNVQPCSPCGPNSEYGPCDPDPQKQAPLKFSCGERTLKDPVATISYAKGAGLPSIDNGLTVNAWARFGDDLYKNCPPTLPRPLRGASLKAEHPEWTTLPKKQLARLTRLKPGDSVTAEVRAQRSYVQEKGTVTKGDDCIKAPDLTDGYSECAVTDYSVTFTRMS